jgi:hypothetical protein
VAIDAFSRKAWVIPLVKKTMVESERAIRLILNRQKAYQPFKTTKHILFDKGTEFHNRTVRRLLREEGVNIISPTTEIKAGIAERFNKSLQSLIYKYMTQNETNRYIDVLPQLVSGYNNRGHRSLAYMSPNQAEMLKNRARVRQLQLKRFHKIRVAALRRENNKSTRQLSVGDVVRIRARDPNWRFRRSYHQQFSPDYFSIERKFDRLSVPMFELRSLDSEKIEEQRFYKEQLQKVTGEIYRIERVVRRRVRRGGRAESFVKWMHFGSKHNTWVFDDELLNI